MSRLDSYRKLKIRTNGSGEVQLLDRLCVDPAFMSTSGLRLREKCPSSDAHVGLELISNTPEANRRRHTDYSFYISPLFVLQIQPLL